MNTIFVNYGPKLNNIGPWTKLCSKNEYISDTTYTGYFNPYDQGPGCVGKTTYIVSARFFIANLS